MKVNPLALLVVACAAMVTVPLGLLLASPTAPPAPRIIPACTPPPPASWYAPIVVPAGQAVYGGGAGANNSNPYGGPIPQWRMSVWSNASGPYDVFVLTQDQYDAYAGSGTGFNGSIHNGPPGAYYWDSGPVTSANQTFLFGNGNWYVYLYNPGSSELTVYLDSESCSTA